MIAMSLKQIAEQLKAEAPNSELVIEQIFTDTRKTVEHGLFIALRGDRFDGHDYLEQARESGAVAAVVEKVMDCELPQVKVNDSLHAMGTLGRAVRQKLNLPLVSITGSSGKTSVKELIASILSQSHEVLATEANYNNEIGVPLTLFRLNDRHEFAVIEMGAGQAGDIDYTSFVAVPDVAIITNIGTAHIERMGSVEGIFEVKSECLNHIRNHGAAVLPEDPRFLKAWQSRIENLDGDILLKTFQIDFTKSSAADYRATGIVINEQGCAGFTAETPHGSFPVELNIPGKHNIANALAAMAATDHLKVSQQDMQQGINQCGLVGGRLKTLKLENGLTIIDDTYNANPESVVAAIDLLVSLSGKSLLILGDMAELGDTTEAGHQRVGDHAREHALTGLITCGTKSQTASDSFGDAAQHFNSKQELIGQLSALTEGYEQILVKGSRSAGMEEVVDALVVLYNRSHNNSQNKGD